MHHARHDNNNVTTTQWRWHNVRGQCHGIMTTMMMMHDGRHVETLMHHAPCTMHHTPCTTHNITTTLWYRWPVPWSWQQCTTDAKLMHDAAMMTWPPHSDNEDEDDNTTSVASAMASQWQWWQRRTMHTTSKMHHAPCTTHHTPHIMHHTPRMT